MTLKKRHLFLLAALLPLSACRPTSPVSYNPTIDPSHFSSTVNHPLFNLATGHIWNYEGTDEDAVETSKTEVTAAQKTVMGVPVTVVRDQVWQNKELIEDTSDYYAQDTDGNVWYFGEAVDNYE